MNVSWNWLSEMVDLKSAGGPEGLAALLTGRGLEVEEVNSQGAGLEFVVTAKILERNPHPQADRLSLCKVSIDSGEPLEIVCGAQNMKAGDIVALAQIGANLPNGLKIALSKIRGVTSNGMLCSETELKIKEESEGILILPPDTPLGRPLAEILGRNDTIFTLKLTANRGDCLSHYGLAREIAAGLGNGIQKVKRPGAEQVTFKNSQVTLSLEAGESAPQFFGISIDGVKIGPSPDWLVRRLEALGSRSINNVVDATNYVMLELGHPTHAYDADRIEGNRVGVRLSKEGETLPLLDGSKITLDGSELVIFDGKRAVGLAGVMGGGGSEVQPGTTRVFLECAEFSPSLVRRAKSRHQKQTDAAHRFERGIDPAVLPMVISRLAGLVMELAGGRLTGGVVAQTPARAQSAVARRKITVDPHYFNAFLGMDLGQEEIQKIFETLDCVIDKSGSNWSVAVPTYRLDLNLKEDLAEEIARSVGYDRIPSTIPALTSQPTAAAADPVVSRQLLIERAKDALVQAGLSETLNFAFTGASWLKEFGLESTARLINPLSEDHECLVPSLIPGLVKNSLENWRHHFGSELPPIRLFELRPTFHFTGAPAPAEHAHSAKPFARPFARNEMDTGVEEKWKLGLAISGSRLAGGLRTDHVDVDFYDLKAVIERLFESLGTRGIRFLPASASRKPDHPILKLLHPHQSVEILAGSAVAGYFGMFHPGKGRDLKARAPLWVAELEWDIIAKMCRQPSESRAFKAWSEFPPMERDFAVLIKADIPADKITQVALKAGKPLAKVVKIFDIYRGSQVPEGMTSVAIRVIFFDEGKSLQEAETDAASTQILSALQKELGAQLRA